MKLEEYYQQFLKQNKYPRKLKSLEYIQGSSFLHLKKDNKTLINFSSSDYLGLTKHPALIQRSQFYTKLFGVGTSSSRLVTGNLSFFEKIENKLAEAIGKPASIILASGYQTNHSVLEALLNNQVLSAKPLVFADKLIHVSMLSATQHVGHLIRYRHNDYEHLEKLFEKHKHSSQPKFILAESVYSMEGDASDLNLLITLAKHYNAFLYVDDAHSVGIYGPQGFGLATHYINEIPIVMGTFSKALGSFGGYIACSETIKEYLVNKCKGLIYSTSLSPAILGAIAAVIEIVPGLEKERARLLNYAARVKHFFQQEGLNVGNSTTHIIPWIIGDAEKTRKISHLLEEEGILGLAIQPPSVPPNKSRIRFCLSAAHTEEDIDFLFKKIKKILSK